MHRKNELNHHCEKKYKRTNFVLFFMDNKISESTSQRDFEYI